MIFKIIGGGLMLLGVIDIISSWVWKDLTGVWWSAFVFLIVGGIIWSMGDKNK